MTIVHFEKRTSKGWVEDIIVFGTGWRAMRWIDFVAENYPWVNVTRVES